MSEKRYRISLLFNANKVYDRQVVEGVGEYLQASQCDWDIFIEEDFCCRIDAIRACPGDGVIADYDDVTVASLLDKLTMPVVGVGGSYHQESDYPPVHYVATDNNALVDAAFSHLKEKGLRRFAFYGLPPESGKRWAAEREYAFLQRASAEQHAVSVYQGMTTPPEKWQHAQYQLADWVKTLAPYTGIIAVTDARARHLLQVCEYLNIAVPDTLSVIGIDDEEMTRYLSRVALTSVRQGTREMGYRAAALLHQLLEQQAVPQQRILIPPAEVIARRSTDFRSLRDPAVIQAMHYIRLQACKGIKVEQVLDAVGLSRSNLEKRFRHETGHSIHLAIHQEKLERARYLLTAIALSMSEVAQMCGYPSLQYFYTVFCKEYNITPKVFRQRPGGKLN
ncbi:MAG: Xylose operon regulatory protein [Candidatus Erwinia impunctatus]|nr:Xylose operon regulatory protein [Culicoides impunctatus]